MVIDTYLYYMILPGVKGEKNSRELNLTQWFSKFYYLDEGSILNCI